MSDLGQVLAVLGFVTVVLQGLLGVANLLVEYKQDGKVTKWGRRALIVTISVAVIALGASVLEDAKKRRDARQELDSTREQLALNQRLLEAAQGQQAATNTLLAVAQLQQKDSNTLLAAARSQQEGTSTVLSNVERVLTTVGGDAMFIFQLRNPMMPETPQREIERLVSGLRVEFRDGLTPNNRRADWLFAVSSYGDAFQPGGSVLPLGTKSPLMYDTSGAFDHLNFSMWGVALGRLHQYPNGRVPTLGDLTKGLFYVSILGTVGPPLCATDEVQLSLVSNSFPIEMKMEKRIRCEGGRGEWAFSVTNTAPDR